MPRDTDELRVPVRSHRDDFAFERRLYAIPLDRAGGRVLRLGPSGVPVRGLAYAAGAVTAALALSAVPLVGAPLRALPVLVAFVALPGIAAALLTMVRPGGRVFHTAIQALLRHLLTPRSLHAFRRHTPLGRAWRPSRVVMVVNGSEPRCRGLRFRGPGLIWIGRPHAQRVTRGPGRRVDALLIERSSPAPTGVGRRIALKADRQIETRPAPVPTRGT